MAMAITDLRTYLDQAFPDAKIDIQSLIDDNDHYAVTITSSLFVGKTKVQQHQMVYRALQGHAGSTLHALSLTTHVKE